jgi:hypothetical protein
LSIVTTKLDALYRKESDPEVRLRNALDDLLVRKRRAPYIQDVAKHCEGLILAVSGLIGKESWATDSYARFLSTLVWSVVGQNAQQLSELVRDDKGNKEFSVPSSAADLADKILEEQMKAMRPGDMYLVVSDLGSWQMGQLDSFMRETENAVKRGIKVRRLFNLLHHDEDYPLPVDAGDILRTHLRIAQNSSEKGKEGRYEVKVLGSEDYKAINRKRPASKKLNKRDVVNAHFGVFRHGDEKIRFQVWRNNLSLMKLCRDAHEVGESLELFECLWPDSAEISESLIKMIEERASRVSDLGFSSSG